MVEMLTGILSGSNFGKLVGETMNPNAVNREEKANLGQCFIAIDSCKLCSGYSDRLSQLVEQMHSLPVARYAPGPVLVCVIANNDNCRHVLVCMISHVIRFQVDRVIFCLHSGSR